MPGKRGTVLEPPLEATSNAALPRQTMRANLKRNLMLGVALAAVIAGVIIAIAPGKSHHVTVAARRLGLSSSAPGDLQLAASYLGLGRAELRRRLQTGETLAEVAAATPGKSAGGLIAAILAPREAQLKAHPPASSALHEALSRSRAQIVAEANHGRGRSGPVPAAASYLGLSAGDLRSKLGQGESLAQIAQAQGRSRTGLIETLVTLKTRRLNTALAEHAITPGEERTALASLRGRVSAAVDQHLASSSG